MADRMYPGADSMLKQADAARRRREEEEARRRQAAVREKLPVPPGVSMPNLERFSTVERTNKLPLRDAFRYLAPPRRDDAAPPYRSLNWWMK